MLIRLRIGHCSACFSISLSGCLCLSVTTAIAGWHLALWQEYGRHRAAFAGRELHTEAMNLSLHA